MTATVALLQNAIKTLYPQNTLEDAYFAECPTFAVLEKDPNWVGNPMHIALALAGTPGSHDFTMAGTVSGTVPISAWQVTWVRDYNRIRITTEAERATRNDAGALMRGVQIQVKGALYTQAKTIGADLWGNGSANRGQIASGQDTTVLQLAEPLDAYNFEVGDHLVSGSLADGSNVTTNSTQISGIDYDAGTLTAAAAWHADFDDNDYLFRRGDATLSMQGFAAWNPSTAPTATPFFGLDRTRSSKLSGVRYNYTQANDGTMARYLVNFATRVCRLGGNPKLAVMGPIRWANFVNELGDACRYDLMNAKYMDGKEASYGFEVISIMGPKGKIKVLADPFCPHDVVRMLDMDHWCFWTLGKMGWIDEDGKGQWLRQESADAKEARLGWFGNLVSDFPGASGVGSVASLPG